MLKDKCPNALQVYDRIFEIETNARLWINISIDIEKHNYQDINFLFKALKNKEDVKDKYINKLTDRLLWFLNCGKTVKELKEDSEKISKNDNAKLYDFEKDEHLIFSAFYRTYKIDIEQELDYLHWWKFKAMFNDLDSESKFVGTYMYYRGLDISESIIFKNANEREKQRMLEMIRYVSLENDDESRSVKDEEIERIKQKRLEILAKQKGV